MGLLYACAVGLLGQARSGALPAAICAKEDDAGPPLGVTARHIGGPDGDPVAHELRRRRAQGCSICRISYSRRCMLRSIVIEPPSARGSLSIGHAVGPAASSSQPPVRRRARICLHMRVARGLALRVSSGRPDCCVGVWLWVARHMPICGVGPNCMLRSTAIRPGPGIAVAVLSWRWQPCRPPAGAGIGCCSGLVPAVKHRVICRRLLLVTIVEVQCPA